jgi:hypothetical protein
LENIRKKVRTNEKKTKIIEKLANILEITEISKENSYRNRIDKKKEEMKKVIK